MDVWVTVSGNVSGWLDRGGTFTKHLLMSHRQLGRWRTGLQTSLSAQAGWSQGGYWWGGGGYHSGHWPLEDWPPVWYILIKTWNKWPRRYTSGGASLWPLVSWKIDHLFRLFWCRLIPSGHWSAGRLTTCSGYTDAGYLVATGQQDWPPVMA